MRSHARREAQEEGNRNCTDEAFINEAMSCIFSPVFSSSCATAWNKQCRSAVMPHTASAKQWHTVRAMPCFPTFMHLHSFVPPPLRETPLLSPLSCGGRAGLGGRSSDAAPRRQDHRSDRASADGGQGRRPAGVGAGWNALGDPARGTSRTHLRQAALSAACPRRNRQTASGRIAAGIPNAFDDALPDLLQHLAGLRPMVRVAVRAAVHGVHQFLVAQGF